MTQVDFPSQVTATDPNWLLGANSTAPAKAAISAAGRGLIAAADDATQRFVLGLGHPVVGSHVLGEVFTDVAGNEWTCIVAGTPGTWRSPGVFQVALGSGAGQIADRVAAAVPTSMTWDLVLINGANVQRSRISVITDTVSTQFNQSAINELGSGFPNVYADLVSGFLTLFADTAGSGWTAVVRRYTST